MTSIIMNSGLLILVIKMIPVVPYIKTKCTENFKNFLNTPFDSKLITKYFKGWDSKLTNGSWKFTNNSITLEFSPPYYLIIKRKGDNNVRLSYPKTLNDFINDMYKLKIELFWSEWVEENFKPKDFMMENEIKEYYRNLLNDLNKGYELLNDC